MRKIIFKTRDNENIGELMYDPTIPILGSRIASLKLQHPFKNEVGFNGLISNDLMFMNESGLLSFLDHYRKASGKIMFSGIDMDKWKPVNVVFILTKDMEDSFIFVCEEENPEYIETYENVETNCWKYTFRHIETVDEEK